MNPPRPFLKIAALSSFILLMSGFVAYKSGLFDRFFKREGDSSAPTENPKTKQAITENDSADVTVINKDSSEKKISEKNKSKNSSEKVTIGGFYIDEMMAGSKSDYVIFDEVLLEDSIKEKKIADPLIMGGSKAGPIFKFEERKEDMKIMGSSKSGLIIDPLPDTAKKDTSK